MLATPVPLHQCSSSPISGRAASELSVVLPVPLRPKNSAVSFRRADIGRAVHRQDAAQRRVEVEQREHRFLDLARIGGAADEHEFRVISSAMTVSVRVPCRAGSAVKLGKLQDRGVVAAASPRVAQQVADEQRVPRRLGDHVTAMWTPGRRRRPVAQARACGPLARPASRSSSSVEAAGAPSRRHCPTRHRGRSARRGR